jgi:hypothetical protein
MKERLMTDPVVAYPRSDRKYVLITDVSTGTDKFVGGFGAILTQVDEKGQYHVIAYGSHQLRHHEPNYSPYLAWQIWQPQIGIWSISTIVCSYLLKV